MYLFQHDTVHTRTAGGMAPVWIGTKNGYYKMARTEAQFILYFLTFLSVSSSHVVCHLKQYPQSIVRLKSQLIVNTAVFKFINMETSSIHWKLHALYHDVL